MGTIVAGLGFNPRVWRLTRQTDQGVRGMDWNRVEGNWKQVKGKVKEQWGNLTDDDLNVIAGKREQLEGKIQERYGIARDQARKEHSRLQAVSGSGVEATRDLAHTGGRCCADEHVGRAATRRDPPLLRQPVNQGNRDDAHQTLGTTGQGRTRWSTCTPGWSGSVSRRGGGLLAQPAGSQSGGAICRPDSGLGRERPETTRARTRQSRQCARRPGDDSARLGSSVASEGRRAGGVV